MKKLITIICILFITACSDSYDSGGSTSPIGPDIPSEPDYSVLSIVSFDFHDPETGFYATACVYNDSAQSFETLYYDCEAKGNTNYMLEYFERGFDIGPYETKCFDNRTQSYDGHTLHLASGPLPSGIYVYDFMIFTYYTNYGGIMITEREQSITIP